MRETITTIVYEALAEANKGLGAPELQTPNLETRLYGAKSSLDSISLVTLIADIEERIGEVFGKDIILADERAMNQRLSPFGRIGTLVDYIEKLLGETE
jgi:acyl carrier protein